MRLKNYYAASLPEAMEQVRAELGPDAVILSSQPNDRGDGIRLTAALDDTGPEGGLAFFEEDALAPLDEINEALIFHRTPLALADRLLAAASGHDGEESVELLAVALMAEFGFRDKPITAAKRPVMLVGPPGAGKTATAAKLCALARLDDESAALVTLDGVKAGALAQAATLSEAMGVTLREATDEASLIEAIAACHSERLVVVDTVGANPFDAGEQARLKRVAGATEAEVVLVLPGGGDPLESADLALAFAEAGAKLLCPTRLDATRRLGGVLAAASAAKLAFFAAGMSPQIAGGLVPLPPAALAERLLNAHALHAGSAEPDRRDRKNETDEIDETDETDEAAEPAETTGTT